MLVTGTTDVLGESRSKCQFVHPQVPHELVASCLSHHVASEA
jgi:hypothetical protein